MTPDPTPRHPEPEEAVRLLVARNATRAIPEDEQRALEVLAWLADQGWLPGGVKGRGL